MRRLAGARNGRHTGRVTIPDGFSMFLQGNTDQMREVQELLRNEGIETRTGPVPASGWQQRAWLAVASRDLLRARELYEAQHDRLIHDETGRRRTRIVADFDAEQTTCPACEATFNPKGVTECPDCGIRFG
jgi:hypothetical protein